MCYCVEIINLKISIIDCENNLAFKLKRWYEHPMLTRFLLSFENNVQIATYQQTFQTLAKHGIAPNKHGHLTILIPNRLKFNVSVHTNQNIK